MPIETAFSVAIQTLQNVVNVAVFCGVERKSSGF